jgi:hypothetical protein
MEAKVGNVSRTLRPREDWTQSKSSHLGSKSEETAPTTGEEPKLVEPSSDFDPLNAARGAVFGVALGSIFWAVLLWALL